jgi:2-polyprenyl-6-methoxyphenol hydroxylase-like FAD-dependent oxidoreductase
MTNPSLHVLIIGAGTGGLALAHGLKRAGIRVSVFERDRAAKDDRGGYRVGISPAGSLALKSCVPPEVYQLFVATCARPPHYFNMLTEQFDELVCLEIEGAAADPVDGEKNVVRNTLRDVLLVGLDDVVFFDKAFERYERNSDGSLTAHFADGSKATGDILIGADGAGSRVRKQRLPHARHEDTGIVSLGGKLPMTAQSRALLSDKMFEGMSMIMAPKGLGAIIHSLEFGRRSANADLIARWPAFFSAMHNDCIGWGLWGARQNLPSDTPALDGESLKQLALRLTRRWHPHMRKMIELTDPTTLQRINIRTSVPLSPWQSDNVTLLGDAIHTMTPGRGAGANTALRDAALLCTTLTGVRDGAAPLVEAIHAYEAEMLRYSTEAVLESRKQMNARDLIHKPMLGRVQLAAMRSGMRVVNAIPPIKRRIMEKIQRVRAAN